MANPMQLAKLTISIAIPEAAKNECPTDDESLEEFSDALDSLYLHSVINAALKEHMVFGDKTPWIEYLEYTVDDGFEKTTSSSRSIVGSISNSGFTFPEINSEV